MTQFEAPVTVLYIVGAGRSGSTILDIVLGNHPKIESTGEVGLLTRTTWISEESIRGIEAKRRRLPLCACGKRLDAHAVDAAETCPLWSSVRREWIERAGRTDVEAYARLQDAFDRYRRWPRLLYERHKSTSQFQLYTRLTRTLFESIRAASGKPVIVDSSKHLPRALALASMPGIDLRLIHLVRDPRGRAASRKKVLRKDVQAGVEWDHKGRSIWGSGTTWTGTNLVSEWVCAQLGPERAIRLHHEDFLNDTKSALDRIGDLVGLDFAGVANAVSSGEPMQVGHNIGGNRVRMAESVRLQPERAEWQNALSDKEQRLLWMLTGPLMRQYGYK
jgi:hypothetical protein